MAPNRQPAFASVALDVDSTLCGIEGIDFLAARRGERVAAEIARVTDRAMSGAVALDQIYGERLTIVRPTRADLAALAEAYGRAIAPGAAEAIGAMRANGVRVVLVSGGIRQAIEPMARTLDFSKDDVVAVSLTFDADGRYVSFDEHSPLTTQGGKAEVMTKLLASSKLIRPVLAVGDGSTDVAMAEVADTFAAFTEFARRPNVIERAALEIKTFAELAKAVLQE